MGQEFWVDVDRRWSNRLLVDQESPLIRNWAAVFARSGDSWLCFSFLGLAYLSVPTWRESVFRMALVILALGLVVFTIKNIFKRDRPRGEWGAIYRKTDPHSFPSGHAARAFLIAVLLSSLVPFLLIFPLLVWAATVSAARVAMGLHFVSDVFVGAILGIVMGIGSLYWMS